MRQHSNTFIPDGSPIVFEERISDKIIKVCVALFCLFFITWSFVIALICIYALPDKTVQPVAGTVYFASGAFALSSLIVVTWKNWASKKP